ncbi:MAG: hypothetical protein EOO24_30420 [Comamonadaceae bacterium]|nr:MAG: hypothetical protein EOO24_30420 [Comamonadaceae bacterium]
MPTSHTIAPRRLALTYCVEGLSVRDDLLLKSLVRVLDHRSHQQWQCVESGGDLRVSGMPFGRGEADEQAGPVLRMGYPPGEGEFGLPMPLHAGHLELMFNRIGDQLAQQRAEAAAAAAQQPVRDDQVFRLRRWPPAALVATPERRSLAALMSVRALSLASLHRLSDVPLPVCIEFLRDLRHADLIVTAPQMPAAAAVVPGADAVGSALAAAAAPIGSQPPAAAAEPPAPSGLLARIRARFGLQPAWSR